MKKYKVVQTKKFLDEMKDAIFYIRNNLTNDISAEKYKQLFKKKILSLERMPNSLPTVNGITLYQHKIHKIRVRRFIIFYVVDEEESVVYVLELKHSSMNWLKSFKDISS